MEKEWSKSIILLISVSLIFSLITGYFQFKSVPPNEGAIIVLFFYFIATTPLILVSIMINSVIRKLLGYPKIEKKYFLIPILFTIISSNFFLVYLYGSQKIYSYRKAVLQPEIEIIEEKIAEVDRVGNTEWGSNKFDYEYIIRIKNIPEKYLGNMTYGVSLTNNRDNNYDYIANIWINKTAHNYITEPNHEIRGALPLHFHDKPYSKIYVKIYLRSEKEHISKFIYHESTLTDWNNLYIQHEEFLKKHVSQFK